MVKLEMQHSGRDWGISQEDGFSKIQWPERDRIKDLWTEYGLAGELEFNEKLSRSNPGEMIFVKLPKGTTPAERQPFLTALALECSYA